MSVIVINASFSIVAILLGYFVPIEPVIFAIVLICVYLFRLRPAVLLVSAQLGVGVGHLVLWRGTSCPTCGNG